MAAFHLLHRKAHARSSALIGDRLLLIISLLVTLIVITANESSREVVGRISSGAWIRGTAWFAVAGFIHFIFGFRLLKTSQRRIGAGRTTTFVATTPVLAAVFGLLLLNETVSMPVVIGIALVVTGTILVARQ